MHKECTKEVDIVLLGVTNEERVAGNVLLISEDGLLTRGTNPNTANELASSILAL